MLIQACDPPAIYSRVYAATGGAKWQHVAQITADGSISSDAQHGSYQSVVDARGGRSLVATDIGGRRVMYVNTGHVVWYRDFSGGVHPFDSPNAQMAAITDAYIARHGYFDRSDPATMRCLARRRVAGVDADAIAITPKGGLTFEQLVDPSSSLILETIRHTPTDTLYTDSSDFREASGVVLPYSITMRAASGDTEIETIKKYGLSDVLTARFERPLTVPNAGFAGSERRTTIPLRVERGDAIVEAFVNGRGPLPFLLDTGGHFILTLHAARSLGLRLAGAGTSGGGGSGRAQTSYAFVNELRLGAAYLKHQPVVVIDYGNDFSDRGKRVSLAGILGLEVFERYAVTIDYGARALTLTDFSSLMPEATAECRPISFQEDMPLSGATVDGVYGLFGIDTGNSGTPILLGPFLQRTGLLRIYTGGAVSTGYGTGGAVSMLSEVLRRLTFDGLSFVDLPVNFVIGQRGGSFSSTTEAGNIGYFVLANFVPTFDYARELLYLQPASHRPPPVYNRGGLALDKVVRDTISVIGVRPGGPGDRAGIRTGDEILAIDGVTAADIGVGDVYAILRKPAGTVLALTVRRKNDVWTTHVTLRVLSPEPTVISSGTSRPCRNAGGRRAARR